MNSYPDPYGRVTFRGHMVDNATMYALMAMEKMLGYELTVVQGGFNGTAVAASAGTHSKGRVVDLAAYDWKNKVRAGRKVGFAMYHRPRLPGVWEEHCHGILALNSWDNKRGVAPLAFEQIVDYVRGRNGLANNGPDTDWRPSPLVLFTYPPKETPVPVTRNNVTEMRDALVIAAQQVDIAITKAQAVKKSRVAVQAQVAPLRAIRGSILTALRLLPKA